MKILKILNILEKYMTENQKKYLFWAEHDILGFLVDYELISQKDLKALEDLDVFYDPEYESLIMFV